MIAIRRKVRSASSGKSYRFHRNALERLLSIDEREVGDLDSALIGEFERCCIFECKAVGVTYSSLPIPAWGLLSLRLLMSIKHFFCKSQDELASSKSLIQEHD